MAIFLDHLVLAAASLDEGAAWAAERLGVSASGGGRHALMGTHNRVVSLGPGRYLEVIAVDPDAEPPHRPRWFSLDEPRMHERLARGPALVHWVVRAEAIEAALEATAQGAAEVLSMSRGDLRWRIGVPPSGRLALAGTVPTVIEWQGAHPTDALPDSGCRLERLVLRHPEAAATLAALHAAGLAAADPVVASAEGAGLEAHVRTPRGIVQL